MENARSRVFTRLVKRTMDEIQFSIIIPVVHVVLRDNSGVVLDEVIAFVRRDCKRGTDDIVRNELDRSDDGQ